jgi:hypothetical protein
MDSASTLLFGGCDVCLYALNPFSTTLNNVLPLTTPFKDWRKLIYSGNDSKENGRGRRSTSKSWSHIIALDNILEKHSEKMTMPVVSTSDFWGGILGNTLCSRSGDSRGSLRIIRVHGLEDLKPGAYEKRAVRWPAVLLERDCFIPRTERIHQPSNHNAIVFPYNFGISGTPIFFIYLIIWISYCLGPWPSCIFTS